MSNPSFEENVTDAEKTPEVPAEPEDENPDDLVGEPVEDDGMPDDEADGAESDEDTEA